MVSALQLSPHHRLIQKQRVRHATTSSLTSSVSALIKFIILLEFHSRAGSAAGAGTLSRPRYAGVAWCYHEMHSFPLFFFLSEGKKSYVPGWRLRDIIFVTRRETGHSQHRHGHSPRPC